MSENVMALPVMHKMKRLIVCASVQANFEENQARKNKPPEQAKLDP